MFDDFIWGNQKKKASSIFGQGIDLGLGPDTKKGRDPRRGFTRTQRNEIWAQQNGKCAKCKKKLDPRTVEYDHKKGWADRGKTVITNGQALCADCHKLKTHNSRLKKIEGNKKKNKRNSIFDLGI